MLPHERSLVKALESKPFTLLGINSDARPRFQAAIKDKGVTWPNFFDGGSTGGPIATAWGVRSWPTTYVLDAQGVIRYKDVRNEAMEEAVNTLLKEVPASAAAPGSAASALFAPAGTPAASPAH